MSNKQRLITANTRFDQTLLKMIDELEEQQKAEGQYVWKKLTAEGGELVDYVTADTEDAYPDGAEQDGYWYERVSEGVSGIDYGEVTLTADASSITIQHNLKKVPSRCILTTDIDVNTSTILVTEKYNCYRGPMGSRGMDTGNNPTMTSSNVVFPANHANIPFRAGTYYWYVAE